MKRLKTIILPVLFVIGATIRCLPPPPELQEAKEIKELQESQPGLFLPKSYTISMGPILATDDYCAHLVIRGLKCHGIDAMEGDVFKFIHKKTTGGITQVDLMRMLSTFKEYGFSVYELKEAELDDLLVLIRNDLPVYIVTEAYCKVGKYGDGHVEEGPESIIRVAANSLYAKKALLVGFDGYQAGQSSSQGNIQLCGYRVTRVSLREYNEKPKQFFLPVPDKQGLEAVKGIISKYHDLHRIKRPLPHFEKVL